MSVPGRPRFKIDEDLPVELSGILLSAGYDAVTVFQQSMHGWKDDVLWPAVAAEGRSLITADVGFADSRRLAGTAGVGIVLFRIWPESRQGYIQLAMNFVNTFPLEGVSGCIVTVTPDAVRIHDTRR